MPYPPQTLFLVRPGFSFTLHASSSKLLQNVEEIIAVEERGYFVALATCPSTDLGKKWKVFTQNMIIAFETYLLFDQCFVNFVQAKFKRNQMRTHATELDQFAICSQTL